MSLIKKLFYIFVLYLLFINNMDIQIQNLDCYRLSCSIQLLSSADNCWIFFISTVLISGNVSLFKC